MRRAFWTLFLLLAPACAARAQVPLSSLSAAGAPASTDTLPVCQTAGGCGAANSLTAANAKSYIGQAAVAGASGNPQYNSGSGFGADAGVFYLSAATGNVTTDTSNLQAAIAAAQSVSAGGVGTIQVPCGTYKINAVTWTGPGPAIVGTCRALSRSESAPYYGSVFLHNAATGSMFADNNTALQQVGPVFENVTFIGQGSGTDTCLYAQTTNFGYVRHTTFRGCGTAIGLYDNGVDDSNWVVTHSEFYSNVTGISCTGTGTSCDNYYGENYISVHSGNIGIYLDGSAQQVRIHGTHFDCGSDNNQTAIFTLGLSVIITGNNFESCSPAVYIPTTATGNQGRGTIIAGNNFTGSYTLISVSCTSSNSSTSLASCTTNPITAGVTAGMLAYGGNIATPYVYGAGVAGSSTNGNRLAGGDTVASTTTSTITLTQATQSSGGGSATFTFCAPQYSWPIALPFPVLSYGNTFVQGCGTLNDGG